VSSTVVERRETGPRWFTFGGWIRGGVTAVAAQILVLAYVVGFGLSVIDAVVVLAQPSAGGSDLSQHQSTALAGYLFLLLLALLAAAVGMRTTAREPLRLRPADLGLRGTATTRRRAPAVAVLYIGLLAGAIGFTTHLLDWCGVRGSGAGSGIRAGSGVLCVEAVHAAIAGLVEEPVLLALPIALGRRARWPWQVTLVVMIAMRIAFHLYYGWDCLFVVPWMIGALVLYRWCPLLWPFVVGHGLFDVLQTLQTYGGHATAVTAQYLLAAATVAATAVALHVVVRCRRAGMSDRGRSRAGGARVAIGRLNLTRLVK
jgi:hypothetical protein